MDNVFGYDYDFFGVKSDGVVVFVIYGDFIFEYEEEIVGVIMFVEGKFIFEFYYYNVVVVVVGDDMWVLMVVKYCEFLGEVYSWGRVGYLLFFKCGFFGVCCKFFEWVC